MSAPALAQAPHVVPSPDAQEMRRAVIALFCPDDVIERARSSSAGASGDAGYFDSEHRENLLTEAVAQQERRGDLCGDEPV
jgi:hypothetical protein